MRDARAGPSEVDDPKFMLGKQSQILVTGIGNKTAMSLRGQEREQATARRGARTEKEKERMIRKKKQIYK